MSDKEPVILVKDLSKRYKLYARGRDRIKDALGIRSAHYSEHMALEHVDLTIYKGETVGIIGTNGSGKSTLLKIITGVLTPTGGQVEVRGRISALLELGAGFNMEYNGIENIYLNGTTIGFSDEEIEARIPAILEFADIGEYVYQPVKMYSSGMFMRLAFAVAINIDPEILIVDEALSVGDVFFQAKCYRKFEEFRKAGRTVLFVSHDLSNISKYCDRVILLNKGQKLGEGDSKAMIDLYKQVLVGQYADDSHEETPEGAGSPAETAGTEGGEKQSAGTAGAAGSSLREGDRNPETLEYGSRKALITDYAILDSRGRVNSTVNKGEEMTVRMKIRAEEPIAAPIFAFTIRNVYGVEICGTNTMVEKAFTSPLSPGQELEVSFTQRIDLQGGEYLISLGLTGFEQEDFTVYHRLYDVMNLTVVSDKNTVGYYDMNSHVRVLGAEEE